MTLYPPFLLEGTCLPPSTLLQLVREIIVEIEGDTLQEEFTPSLPPSWFQSWTPSVSFHALLE